MNYSLLTRFATTIISIPMQTTHPISCLHLEKYITSTLNHSNNSKKRTFKDLVLDSCFINNRITYEKTKLTLNNAELFM